MAATEAGTTAEAATTSGPEPYLAHGRLDLNGAAAARSEELFTAHARMVSGLCRVLLRDPEEAEDAAQQTFLSAHRALLNGSEPRDAAPWLATIARNECRGRIRVRMRAPLLLGETEPVAGASDALSEAIRRADLAALWCAIDELPRAQRDVLLLREFGGLSYEELAAALAVSGSAIESLLFRARRTVKERLREAYAAVGDAGLLSALGRLLAGSGVAAPVTAKAVAIGVGAAVVAGGAVVAPQMLDHRRAPIRSSLPRPAHVRASASVAAPVHGPAPAPHLRASDLVVIRTAAPVRRDSGDDPARSVPHETQNTPAADSAGSGEGESRQRDPALTVNAPQGPERGDGIAATPSATDGEQPSAGDGGSPSGDGFGNGSGSDEGGSGP